MKKKQKQSSGNPQNEGVNKGFLVAYSILFVHLILIAVVGCLVLFFRGIVNYMLWIFVIGSLLITYSGVRIYKRMKHEKKNLRDMLQLPMFEGKSVEVDLFGGMASVKIKQDGSRKSLPLKEIPMMDDDLVSPQLEDPSVLRVRELTELARLYENNLLTREEFELSKKQLMQSGRD